MELPIKLLYKPINRHQKRAIIQERKRILPDLLEVEFSFYQRLFFSVDNDYSTLYQLHLEWFKSRVDFTKTIRKPKWHSVDEMYFTELLKPIETQKEH